jgi:rhamnogalacturonan endolyase
LRDFKRPENPFPPVKSIVALLLALVVLPIRANDPGGGAPGVGANVTLTDNGSTVTLSNGQVSATITKSNAKFTSYTFRGVPLTTSTRQIYYSMDGGANYRQPSGCTYTVKTNTPDMVDIGMRQTWTTQAQAVDIEVHYVLRRGDTGIYTYAILDHPDTYPATSFGEWRMVWKLPDNTFERLYVDDLRNRQMPTAADYAAASPTSIAEIVKLNTGVLAGQYEGKYCYNSNYRKNPVWGHATNDEDIGVWLVTGGHEFFNDGPMKQDLAPADRILHIHFGMNHFNGSSTSIAAGEAWRKLYGPFLLYCNHDPAGADACWADAKEQAAAEQAAWPYSWLTGNPDYPLAAGRATVSGTLDLNDPLKPLLDGEDAWVGLAAPDAGGNWQFESKRYQHWIPAGPDGAFTIPHVRPGTYTLYAFTAGAAGEYKHSSPVTVTAGQTLNLGTLSWNIARSGTWLAWEIGTADRDSREFRHGNDYFTPHLYEQFSSELPNPLEYTIGSSNPATDWNYAHTGYFTAAGSANWKWRIHFNLPSVPATGNARFHIAFAGSHYSRMHLYVNDETTQFGPILYPNHGNGNGLLRQTNLAKYSSHIVEIPVSRLRAGSNIITLVQGRSTNTSDHVMYDYLALEMPTLPGGTASDADNDGLADAWEILHFGNLLQNGSGDPDLDGANNEMEESAGSDPNSATSWPDLDRDLLPDAWELARYPSITTASPLDDSDGDGFNTWAEYRAGTDPLSNSSFPAGATTTIRIAPHPAVVPEDLASFDGTLYEVDGSGSYSGSFVINDPNRRNIARQGATRHYLNLFKFDLTALPRGPVTDATLGLTVNGSSSGVRTRTVAAFNGSPSVIQPTLRYDAANPFLRTDYAGETNTDTDFLPGTLTTLFTFANQTTEGVRESLGGGNANFRNAIESRRPAGNSITLLLYGGDGQYLTYGSEHADPAVHPALVITTAGDPAPDDDLDQLPDAWEAQKLSSLAFTGTSDPDNDGSDNAAEFAAGSDPLSLASTPADHDGDGTPNASDAFPDNPEESLDTDLDGIGNNSDPDDDNDGYPDNADLFPLDPAEWSDADNDGIGDNADPDDDNDLLPDAWELLHFTNLLQSAADDPDGDATENHAEFLLNLNPANPNSRFTATAAAGHVIQWQGVAGLSFKIQRSGNLASWSDLATVAGTSGQNSYTDASPLPGRNFYRVVLLP